MIDVPRPGMLGLWERVVGPGMTRGETRLVLAACALGAACAAARMSAIGAEWYLVLLAGVMGFDLFGGAVCNATDTTKAWYHRSSVGWRDHALFVAPHVGYVVVVAALLRGPVFDVRYGIVVTSLLFLSASLVLASPPRLKRAVAAGLCVAALGVVAAGGPTRGLEWFAPALFLKLLAGHLVPA